MTTTTTTAAPLPIYTADVLVEVPDRAEYFRGRPYFHVRMTITAVTGFLDKNLFLHERVPLASPDFRDNFIGVAGPVDLVDYTSEPDERMRLRKDVLDMLIESHELYDQLVDSVRRGLEELVEGSRRMDILVAVDNFRVE